MNVYDLIASLFASLASLGWPISLVVCVYLFRERLQEILPRLHLKHKDTEISFQIEAAKVQAETIPLPKPDQARESSAEAQNVKALAGQSPEAAMLWAWVELEAKIRMNAKSLYQIETGNRRSLTGIVNELHSIGGINRQIAQLVFELRDIRNRIAHPTAGAESAETEDALSFVELVGRVSTAIDDMPSLDEIEAAYGFRKEPDTLPNGQGQ